MFILPTDNLPWRLCRKVQPIRAKPMVTLLIDRSVATCFLLNTLEGREPIGPDAMFCIGAAGDAWQQTPSGLLKKYDVTSVDGDGWMVCTPKPGNAERFFELTPEFLTKAGCIDNYGYVVGKWGEEINGHANLQKFKTGDYLLNSRTDSADFWIVNRRLWLNSYTEIEQTE